MRRLPFRIAVLVISTVTSAAVMGLGDNDVMLKQISGYRQWTKMNPDAVKIENTVNLAALAGG